MSDRAWRVAQIATSLVPAIGRGISTSELAKAIADAETMLAKAEAAAPPAPPAAVKNGKRHELKSWPSAFQAVLDGRKRHEWRFNDRDFHEGDVLLLREYDPYAQKYSGREIEAFVTCITKAPMYDIPPQFCVMTIALAKDARERDRAAWALMRQCFERAHDIVKANEDRSTIMAEIEEELESLARLEEVRGG